MSRLQTVQIVSIHQPKVVAEYNLWGGVDIKIDDFTFAQIHYDHRYTDNAHRKAAADCILEFLGVDPKAEGVNVSAPLPDFSRLRDGDIEYKSWLAALAPASPHKESQP